MEGQEQHASLGILYEAMVQLTVEPGRFDSIARRLTADLNMVLEGTARQQCSTLRRL
jgi:hypothetical protein